MHTKHTVKYICDTYPSGNKYYYKKEIITHDSWDNLDSLQWGKARPISEKTFQARKKEGYRVEVNNINKPIGTVLPFRSQFK